MKKISSGGATRLTLSNRTARLVRVRVRVRVRGSGLCSQFQSCFRALQQFQGGHHDHAVRLRACAASSSTSSSSADVSSSTRTYRVTIVETTDDARWGDTVVRRLSTTARGGDGDDDEEEEEENGKNKTSSPSIDRVRRIVRATFLPAGYPNAVSNDYDKWLPWHLASLFARDIIEVLTAQSLVVAVGLGAAPGALPLAAAAKWVLKDGVGSFATLLAGGVAGNRYDEDVRRWWVASSILEDAARILELLTPFAPNKFLVIAGSASLVRAVAVTGRNSLINGAIMRHIGRAENFSDVRAKLEVQGRMLALASLPAGLLLFRAAAAVNAEDTPIGAIVAVVGSYVVLFLGHGYACYKSACALELDTLNRRRLALCAMAFACGDSLPTPSDAALREGVFANRFPLKEVAVACKAGDAARDSSTFDRLAAACVAGAARGGAHIEDVAPFVVGFDEARARSACVCVPPDAPPINVRLGALAAAKASALIAESNDDMHVVTEASAWAAANESEFEEALRRSGWRSEAVLLGAAPRVRVAVECV